MTPIPNSALPVVEILRRDVKRPDFLPRPDDALCLRWRTPFGKYCPMGFHPKAQRGTPITAADFGMQTEFRSVEEFAMWWDSLREADAAEAMEMIWPSDNPHDLNGEGGLRGHEI